MVETTIVLGTTAQHLGMPLADLMAWALVLAFLAVPVSFDTAQQGIFEIGGAKLQPAAARRLLDTPPVPDVTITLATARVPTASQWQTVTRLVGDGAERMMAVARDHQAIRRELDSLDLTLDNMRRDLASVMSSALPPLPRAAELVPLPVRRLAATAIAA